MRINPPETPHTPQTELPIPAFGLESLLEYIDCSAQLEGPTARKCTTLEKVSHLTIPMRKSPYQSRLPLDMSSTASRSRGFKKLSSKKCV